MLLKWMIRVKLIAIEGWLHKSMVIACNIGPILEACLFSWYELIVLSDG